jgi:hypothetical protein
VIRHVLTHGQERSLLVVKVVHTIVWVFFVACIVAVPVLARRGAFAAAALCAVVVLAEVLVLALNRWSCPLTPLAGRYTEDRRPNFDIFLPEWLARHNKTVFGWLYAAGLVYLIASWVSQFNSK